MCCVPLSYLIPLGKKLTPCSQAVVVAVTHSREASRKCLACCSVGLFVTRQKRDLKLLILVLGGREIVSAAKFLSSRNILSHWNTLSSYPWQTFHFHTRAILIYWIHEWQWSVEIPFRLLFFSSCSSHLIVWVHYSKGHLCLFETVEFTSKV